MEITNTQAIELGATEWTSGKGTTRYCLNNWISNSVASKLSATKIWVENGQLTVRIND